MQSIFHTKDDDGGCDDIKIEFDEGKIVLDKLKSSDSSACSSWVAEISMMSNSSVDDDVERRPRSPAAIVSSQVKEQKTDEVLPNLPCECCSQFGSQHCFKTTEEKHDKLKVFSVLSDDCQSSLRRSPRRSSEMLCLKRKRNCEPADGGFICSRGRGGRYIRPPGLRGRSRCSATNLWANGFCPESSCDGTENEDVADFPSHDDRTTPVESHAVDSLQSTEESVQLPALFRKDAKCSGGCQSLQQQEGSDSGVSITDSVDSSANAPPAAAVAAASQVLEHVLPVQDVKVEKREDGATAAAVKSDVVSLSVGSFYNSGVIRNGFKRVFWNRKHARKPRGVEGGLGAAASIDPATKVAPFSAFRFDSSQTSHRLVPSIRSAPSPFGRSVATSFSEDKKQRRSLAADDHKTYLKKELQDLIEGSIKMARIAALTYSSNNNSPFTTTSQSEEILPGAKSRAVDAGDSSGVTTPKISSSCSTTDRNVCSSERTLGTPEEIGTSLGDDDNVQVMSALDSRLSGIRRLPHPSERNLNAQANASRVSPLEPCRATKCKALQRISELVKKRKAAIRMQLQACEKRKRVSVNSFSVNEPVSVSPFSATVNQNLSVEESREATTGHRVAGSTCGAAVEEQQQHSSSLASPADETVAECRRGPVPNGDQVLLASRLNAASVEAVQCQVMVLPPVPSPEMLATCGRLSPPVIDKLGSTSPEIVVKRPPGRPRIHRPPQLPKPVRLSRNGRRLGRPPVKVNGESSEGVAASDVFAVAVDHSKMPCLSPVRQLSPLPTSKSVCLPVWQSLPSYATTRSTVPLNAYHAKRSSVRQTECAFRYREIAIRKHDNFIQIVLTSTTRVKNGLNAQVLTEMKMALSAAKSDLKCNAVLLNGTGSVFCSGVDLISLVSESSRNSFGDTLADAVKDFVKAVLTFPKPLVAAVNGAAVGLGVTILPLFDLVYASDKATFYTPYGKLGQIPEGGATFSLPLVMGFARANGLLLNGRKLTASEALDCGLVTQVLWPATFMEEVIPRVQSLAAQSPKILGTTKTLIRYHSLSKLEVTIDTECRMLSQQWKSQECLEAVREFLKNEEIV